MGPANSDSEQPRYQSRSWLTAEFQDKNQSLKSVADECGVAESTIYYWLDKFGIPTDSSGDTSNIGNKYRDENWLREQYVDRGRRVKTIADKCGVERSTIYHWLEKFDIDRDRGVGYRPPNPERYRDEDWLREQYTEEKLTTREIADLCDCSAQCIRRWMQWHGIQPRVGSESQGDHKGVANAHFRTVLPGGYERWSDGADGSTTVVLVHRLLAVAEHGFDAPGGMHVHHKNGVPWDNRPDNIELLTPSEHRKVHASDD